MSKSKTEKHQKVCEVVVVGHWWGSGGAQLWMYGWRRNCVTGKYWKKFKQPVLTKHVRVRGAGGMFACVRVCES